MKEIRFVDVGEGITEGHIQKWLVNDGDAVKEDQSLVMVETDKAVVNVPSPIDGFVKVVAKENTTVHVGDLVAQIGTKEELSTSNTSQKPAEKPEENLQQKADVPAAAPQSSSKEIITTP
ncbi:MAG: biotin/lipoyl-containing protein, partial [Candidatus Micrarchaeaceae archaeon]